MSSKVIKRTQAGSMSAKVTTIIFAIAVGVTVLLMCSTFGVTIHKAGGFNPENPDHLPPFEDYQSKYNKIKIYHSLFLVTFVLSLLIAALGILNEDPIVLTLFAIVTLLSEATRFLLFVLSSTVYKDTGYEEEKITEYWLAYGAVGLEVVTQLFYAITLIATAAIITKFWSREVATSEVAE